MKNRKRHQEIDQDKMPCDCCATDCWDSDLLELREAKTAEIAAKPVITREEMTERTLTLCERCNEEAESDLDLAPDGDVLAPDVFEKFWQWSHLNAILNFIGSENQPNTVEDVAEFFDALSNFLIWHPETCFKDYASEQDGKALFDAKDAIELDHIMERCEIICQTAKKDVYELARIALAKTWQVLDDPQEAHPPAAAIVGPGVLDKMWVIQADPEHAGKHPAHDCRFITTEDCDMHDGHNNPGSIICSLRDLENQKEVAQHIVDLHNIEVARNRTHKLISKQ